MSGFTTFVFVFVFKCRSRKWLSGFSTVFILDSSSYIFLCRSVFFSGKTVASSTKKVCSKQATLATLWTGAPYEICSICNAWILRGFVVRMGQQWISLIWTCWLSPPILRATAVYHTSMHTEWSNRKRKIVEVARGRSSERGKNKLKPPRTADAPRNHVSMAGFWIDIVLGTY